MDIKGGGVDQVKALTAMVNEGKPFCEICAKAKKLRNRKREMSRLHEIGLPENREEALSLIKEYIFGSVKHSHRMVLKL